MKEKALFIILNVFINSLIYKKVKDSSIRYESAEEKIIKVNDIIEDVKILIKFNDLT